LNFINHLSFLIQIKSYAEPLKARKRTDPQIEAQKSAKRKKKIEREIIKLERFGRKLKPIEENEPDRSVFKTLE
jgi:hypothetical protein